MDSKQRGALKIISGIVLMLAGGLGFVFGRSIKQRVLRITIFVFSALFLGSGFYLFVDGVEDKAIGSIGSYEVGKDLQQTIIFEQEPGDKMLFGYNKTLRRLKFECPDGSKRFVVYQTPFGAINVPKTDIICDDGFKLVEFKK